MFISRLQNPSWSRNAFFLKHILKNKVYKPQWRRVPANHSEIKLATMAKINAFFVVKVLGSDGRWKIAMEGDREYPQLPYVEQADISSILRGVEPVLVGAYTKFDGEPVSIVAAEVANDTPVFPMDVFYIDAHVLARRMRENGNTYNLSIQSGIILRRTQRHFEDADLPPLGEWLQMGAVDKKTPEVHCCPICLGEDDTTIQLP